MTVARKLDLRDGTVRDLTNDEVVIEEMGTVANVVTNAIGDVCRSSLTTGAPSTVTSNVGVESLWEVEDRVAGRDVELLAVSGTSDDLSFVDEFPLATSDATVSQVM